MINQNISVHHGNDVYYSMLIKEYGELYFFKDILRIISMIAFLSVQLIVWILDDYDSERGT